MGCATSKKVHLDVRRSSSPPHRKSADSRHVVALVSSTLGSLELPPTSPKPCKPFSTVTPHSDPETINTWELMKDLASPLPPSHALNCRSFSFGSIEVTAQLPSSKMGRSYDSPNSTLDVMSTMRKALVELSPRRDIVVPPGTVRARVMALQEKIDAKKARARSFKRDRDVEALVEKLPTKVVVYFTSLRGVRKTYDDCCWVREIVRECGVWVDERDVSMDRGFREELGGGGAVTLPKVFVGGRCLGGVEEVRRMHEAGELAAAFRGCERGLKGGGMCEACGDVRFVPCRRCSGSRKVYIDEGEEEQEEEEEEEEEEVELGGGFRRCPECNENGIVRCPVCC